MKTFRFTILLSLFIFLLLAVTAAISETVQPEKQPVPKQAIALRACGQVLGFIISYDDGTMADYPNRPDLQDSIVQIIENVPREHLRTIEIIRKSACEKIVQT